MKMKTHLARSFIIHLVLLLLIFVVIVYEPQSEPAHSLIQINSISFKKEMKRVFHRVIHTVGIPHEEVENEEASEKTEETTGESKNAQEGSGLPPSEMQKYIAEVVGRIERLKQYPKDAIFNEQEGLVEVLIEIAPDGKMISTQISQSTPFDSLNGAALQAVQKLGQLPPLPKLPSGAPVQNPIQLRVPIHFQLK